MSTISNSSSKATFADITEKHITSCLTNTQNIETAGTSTVTPGEKTNHFNFNLL